MGKYLVEGTIPFKIEVEADSEDEALEMAEENFDFETHVDTEASPTFSVANSLGGTPEEDEDDEDYSIRSSRRSYEDDEEED